MIFRFYTPEAERLSKKGTVYTSNGSIDCSDGVPHVEWNFQTAKNYIEMPNKVEKIEKNIESVSKSMLTFVELMDKIMLINYIQS